MSEEVIVKYCSPTLAGIKTGSLFSCSYNSKKEVCEFLRELNISLRHKGVRFMPLRFKNKKVLIYAYRPSRLLPDVQGKEADELLTQRGYCTQNCGSCLARLMKRLGESDEFPHEIGLFLGYPAVDVRGFIRHGECKCTGLWKVYESDVPQAQRTFARCRHCTKAYLQRNREGWDLSRLTIRPGQFSYREAERLERKETT